MSYTETAKKQSTGIEIYYFSGTGNSLAVARDLAGKLAGKLIPVASIVDNEEIRPQGDIIGIVFPVYNIEHTGIPLIIKRFVQKLECIEPKYIFAVCTFGGGSYKALDNLNALLRLKGGRLSAGFGVQMPQNAFDNKILPGKEKMFRKWEGRIDGISRFVLARKTNSFNDMRNRLVKVLISPIIKKEKLNAEKLMQGLSKSSSQDFGTLIQLSDNSYSTDENCNGCGICSKVCPVNNIEMVNQKPHWLNRCETCLACFHWCPRKAIHGGIVGLKGDEGYRYRHPGIALKDMITD